MTPAFLAVGDHNNDSKRSDKIKDLEKYKHQFIPAKNNSGEKVIWVNYFCSTDKEWKRILIVVDDGGSCYFNLYVNLNKETYDRFIANGQG